MDFLSTNKRLERLEHHTKKCEEASSHYHVVTTKISYLTEALHNKIEQDKEDKEKQCNVYKELLEKLNEIDIEVKLYQEKLSSSADKTKAGIMKECNSLFVTKEDLQSDIDKIKSAVSFFKTFIVALSAVSAWVITDILHLDAK